MKKNYVVSCALVLGMAMTAAGQAAPAAAPPASTPAATAAPTPTRIGIINITAAILATKDGQRAAADLKAKFDPKKGALEKRQADVQGLQDQLRKGAATMSDEAKARMERDIATNDRSLKNDADDLNTEVDQDQQKLMQDIWGKMNPIINQYATQNGYAVVLDVSNQQGGVIFGAADVNITPDIIKLYDQAHPGTAAPAAAKPATPAPPKPGASATPAAAPVKK
ncbi:MAG: OmpH family outer membrane protein [Bryobacteraceae bacterium]